MNIRNSLIGLILAVLGVVAAHGGAGQNDSSVESETLFNPSLSYAQVQFATAVQLSDGRWRFDVTLLHNDEGWEHYANAWQVIDPDSGKILGERILAHPHDNEQPFSRSLGGIRIPAEFGTVVVRATCNVHGFGGRKVLVDLSESEGERYRVQRLPR